MIKYVRVKGLLLLPMSFLLSGCFFMSAIDTTNTEPTPIAITEPQKTPAEPLVTAPVDKTDPTDKQLISKESFRELESHSVVQIPTDSHPAVVEAATLPTVPAVTKPGPVSAAKSTEKQLWAFEQKKVRPEPISVHPTIKLDNNLHGQLDPTLQKGLENTLNRLGLKSAIEDKRLCVALVDISNIDSPRVASVNGDDMIYAASLPKIAILLGAFVEIERGKLQFTTDNRESLTRMIRVSSNKDATKMLNRVGKERLAEILQSDRFRLYDKSVNGGLWVGKDYGKAPAWRRDPLHNLSHGATALQVARFYFMMENGQLVSPELTREMKSMLGNPGITHKFVKGLKNTSDTQIYRKSGSWKQWHADSALIEHAGHKYILVALAKDKRGGEWLARIAAPLDKLIVPDSIAAR